MNYDRAWYHETFLKIFRGWYRILEYTSDSFGVWQPPNGIALQNFVSKSGLQCDGVPRMMPALAAWSACEDNPATIPLEDGRKVDPREILFKALVHGTDPDHRDFWLYVPRKNQRQVESSIVAWSLWLSRDWLMPRLSPKQVANVQKWLASCTADSDHFNNWSLFTATNHAARYTLREHGFEGSLEEIRRDLIPGDELYLGDGWMFDNKYSNIDYYNFWVFGSHNCYLRAMLPDYENPMLERSLRKLSRRLRDLPYLIDANGLHIQFGRSLPYRWGWLSGLIAAHYIGIPAIDPGLSRAMLARNLQAWLDLGSMDEGGGLRERLTPHGSAGGSSSYINCGHPYWGMQAFLCLALPDRDPFWSAPAKPLAVEESDFQEPRQGPGFVFQGFQETGEVRLFSLRNLYRAPAGNALYDKFVYSSRFPCNSATTAHLTVWDNQFAIRLPDGTPLTPEEVLEADTNDGRTVHTIRRFSLEAPDRLEAIVRTRLTIDGSGYTSEHLVEVETCQLEDASWIEGGFPLSFDRPEDLQAGGDGETEWARLASGARRVSSQNLAGWEKLSPAKEWKRLKPACEDEANILRRHSVHCLLTAPIRAGKTRFLSRHEAKVATEEAEL